MCCLVYLRAGKGILFCVCVFAHLFSDTFVVLIPVTIGNQSVSLARELLIDCSVSNSLI